MKIFKYLTLAIAIVFGGALTASAAQYHFTPRLFVSEQYTDNVFRSENNTEDDFITNVGAGFTIEALGKTSGLDLSFDPSYSFYAQNTRDDTWRLPARLRIWNDFSQRTRFDFINNFIRTEDPQGDEALRDDSGRVITPGDSSVRRGREPFYRNTAIARVGHQFGSDDSLYAQFLYSLLRNDDADANDNDRYAPSAGLTYWFGPRFGTEIEAEYTRAEFEDSPNYDDLAGRFQLMTRFTRHFQIFGRYGYAYRDNDDNVDDYQVHAPSAGIIYDVAKDATFSAGLGYFYQKFDDSDVDDEKGLFLNADIFKLWDYRRWNARVQGASGLDRNDYGSERLGFRWYAALEGTVTYDFTRNFFGNIIGQYGYSDYFNINREDNRARVGAGLGWLPTRWMTLTLDYEFNRLDSTGTQDFDENRVTLRIFLQPDQPWKF